MAFGWISEDSSINFKAVNSRAGICKILIIFYRKTDGEEKIRDLYI